MLSFKLNINMFYTFQKLCQIHRKEIKDKIRGWSNIVFVALEKQILK